MVERRGDVRLVLIDHPGEGLQLRCPPTQAPCPPGPEGLPQLRHHLRRPRAVESFPHSRPPLPPPECDALGEII